MRKGKDKNAEKYIDNKHNAFNQEMQLFATSQGVYMNSFFKLISKMSSMKDPIENAIIQFKKRAIMLQKPLGRS